MACAQQPPPETEIKLVYPVLPQTSCAAQPAPPADAAVPDDHAIIQYFESVRVAGADCRTRLKAVHDSAAKWPAAIVPPAK